MSQLLPITALFILPIIAIIVMLFFTTQEQHPRVGYYQLLLCTLSLVITGLLFLGFDRTKVITMASWPAPFGITLLFDTLTKFMLLVFSFIGLVINYFSLGDHRVGRSQCYLYCGYWLLMLGITGALATVDIFNLYVWCEVILVSAFIILRSDIKDNTKPILHYATINITGTLLLLIAIGLLYASTGQLNMAAIAESIHQDNSALCISAMALLLLGLGIKGAIFPLYFWLPEAYPNTSSSATLLLSSFVTKVIMLVILRLVWLWPPLQAQPLQSLFIALACCTMVFGVFGAANEHRMRSILSFHIISQLGYILLAIFIPSQLAIVAALYFLIHNVFVKSTLIMVAGIIEQHCGTDDLGRVAELLKACPLLGLICFIAAMSLAGIPPLSGFWAKLLVLIVSFTTQHYAAVIFAIIVSLLTLYSMIKIWRYGFCQANETANIASKPFQLTTRQTISLIGLSIPAVVIGLLPIVIFPVLERIAAQLTDTTHVINLILGG
ncbi:MAG: hypothetical protein CMF50_07275 [Legionellales bacterium]|nr:hypothetical protein [Legionellales bacterium]|tara:strand:+ start:43811 stop:45298 length:1488 start_codon:yes stop_codon:yes gene_type:complete